ncbi:oxygen-independent coproporphyrinogen III oxidase [Olivibacter ginsenosidimutans]|uniref:Coproporphyrinogen-III oxidase n=1 Tax=Olivibacter ginsenosidimutans TaxID=1176537 RepID=A0ABP9BHP6_9SPHI
MYTSTFKKYNIPVPRYTSYPTVPCWDSETWSTDAWLASVQQAAEQAKEGISIYIHLPYCERLCTYCGCNTRITKNHNVELPYLTAVLQEWQMYLRVLPKDISINDIHLGGGTPTFFSPENLSFLINELLTAVKPVHDAEFSFEAHPANTSQEHLETLYGLGFRRLSLGIQDFNPTVQRVINRQQSPADVIRVMQQARRIGYTSINFDLIYGLPLQTLESVAETIKIAMAMQPDRIAYYSYAHVPWLKPGQRLFTEADLPSTEEKFNLYQRGTEIIKAAGYLDIGMDHFAFPTDKLAIAAQSNCLHRNFMGYTDKHSPLLLGLGVSSISDSWTAFAQNVKTVKEYEDLIAQGKWPVCKGHVLTEEDIAIRKQILGLMCSGQLDLAEMPLSETTKQRLKPLITDGMVAFEPGILKVTHLGSSFLRNICAAFDERMDTSSESNGRFSKAI